MSIQSQIERINNAKTEIISAIESKGVSVATGASLDDMPRFISDIPQEGGSGGAGGIIDVTELPTSNIDTNAVYRVTENVQLEKTEIYIRTYLDGQNMVITAQQYLAYLGVPTVPNIYVVDALSGLKTTDIQYFTEVNIYILRSDGICYINAPAAGGIITLGLMGFQKTGYDKGFTENAYEETEYGVYTTIEAYKEVIRYFVRKGGKWEELSATISRTLPNGFNDVESLTGEYVSYGDEEINNASNIIDVEHMLVQEKKIPSRVLTTIDVSAMIDGSITNVPEEYFVKANGEIIDRVHDHVFYRQYKMQSANIPRGVKSIGISAFQESYSLESVSLPEGLETIGSSAFADCQNLYNIPIPSSVINIGDQAFRDCRSLTSVSIPDGVTEIGRYAFDGCYKLSSVLLPDNLEKISTSAFEDCMSLSSISLPNNLIMLDSNAFSGCSSLISIAIPENITSISSYTFYACSNLSSVTLNNNISVIGDYAFGDCLALSTMTFKSKPRFISFWAFSGCVNLTTIKVPWSEGEVSNAPWGAPNVTEIKYNHTEE